LTGLSLGRVAGRLIVLEWTWSCFFFAAGALGQIDQYRLYRQSFDGLHNKADSLDLDLLPGTGDLA
jgi:hypothetical protein